MKKVHHISKSSIFRSSLLLVMLFMSVFVMRLASGAEQPNDPNKACSQEVFLTQQSKVDSRYSQLYRTSNGSFSSFEPVGNKDYIGQDTPQGGLEVNAIGLLASNNTIYGLEPTELNVFGFNSVGSLVGRWPRVNLLYNNKTPSSGFYTGDIRNSAFIPSVGGPAGTTNSLAPDNRLYTYNLDNILDDGTTHKLFSVVVKDNNGIYGPTSIDMTGAQNTDFDPDTPLNTNSLSNYQLSHDLSMNDWAFSPKNGLLYGYDSVHKRILSVNPATGIVEDRSGVNLENFGGAQKVGNGDGSRVTHGASWFDAQGRFYTYRNADGYAGGAIFRFNINGNKSVDLQNIATYTNAQASQTNDGAACPGVGFSKSVQSPVVEGSTTTYTYTLHNNANVNMTANLYDDLNSTDIGARGRQFIAPPTYPDPTDFVSQGTVTSASGTVLDIRNIVVKPNTDAVIKITVQTAVNLILGSEILPNTANLRNIRVTGIDVADLTASADLQVNELPGAKPYLKVYGNDVAVGSSFRGADGVLCGVSNPEAKIRTLATQSGSAWIGASSQLATFATGTIDQFFSAGMRNGSTSDAKPTSGLTFGNSSLPWGGKIGATRCMPDYYSLVSTSGGSLIPGGVQGAKNVAVGEHTAVYFPGDVTISGNIAYDSTGSWADLNAIPSFYLVAKGNIYIRSNVTNLDGVYVAWPTVNGDGTLNNGTGNIYTCTLAGNNTPNQTSDCNQQLKINGAFIARKVYFQRTKGDAKLSTSNEAPTANMAEVFDFSQETYLGPLAPSLRSSTPYGKYDSIVSLPPVL